MARPAAECGMRIPCATDAVQLACHRAAAGNELAKWTGPESPIQINQTIAALNVTMAYITRNYVMESKDTMQSWCALLIGVAAASMVSVVACPLSWFCGLFLDGAKAFAAGLHAAVQLDAWTCCSPADARQQLAGALLSILAVLF